VKIHYVEGTVVKIHYVEGTVVKIHYVEGTVVKIHYVECTVVKIHYVACTVVKIHYVECTVQLRQMLKMSCSIEVVFINSKCVHSVNMVCRNVLSSGTDMSTQ
jgi:hypothetical protein